MYGMGSQPRFLDHVQGTWGSFSTPAGRVDYIMTKARLGEDANDPERRLTKSLAPVREVMEAGDLDFNQLLQRDLDDHRVAVQLIPYLMTEQANGPAFFPPVVAVLLPFRNKRPSQFASLQAEPTPVADDGAEWLQQRAGGSFQIQRLATVDGRLHPGSIGKLWWNSAEAQLVVLDGQHRAMALLAVERTMTKSWQGSSGAKYRSFYEHQVQQLLEDRGGGLDLSKVEVPVTVCWFPQQTGEGAKPHEAARKLFVDVNKEARPPSESRIILLSDAELKNILTRRLLSELRGNDRGDLLPLYAVEYDNPQVNANRPARWSVLTSITVLKAIVERLLFGPARQLQDVASKQGPGRPNVREQDDFLRAQLDIASLFDEVIDDGGFPYQRDELGNGNFPLGQVDTITERFAATWGRAALILLSATAPYAAHSRALTALKESWHRDDSSLALAYDALFSGVGVFWTLRASHDDFVEKKSDGLKPGKSDVIVAWESLDKREEDFEQLRAKEYLDSATLNNIKRSKAAFAVFNTQACQIGQMLTLGTLWELRKQQGRVDLDELPAFASALVDAWNAYFAEEHGKGRDRKLAFNNSKSDITNPLNQIGNMDTPQATYFRYFWMQALDTPAAWERVSPWFPDRRDFSEALGAARAFYWKLLIRQNLSALKTSRPGTSQTKLEQLAQEISHKALMRALRDWFYLDEEQYSHWAACLKVPSQRSQEDAVAAGDATAAVD
jgi:DNA-sulfur modification-associated